MKKTVLILALIFLALGSNAQRRYKDLFPLLADMSNTEIKNSLKEYLTEDTEHPHANFRLALVYEENYKTGDLRTDYEFTQANADQARLKFIKAKQLVDDREVNRNNEYYFPTFKTFDSKGKPEVAYSLVSKKMTDGYDSCLLFLSKTPPIYKNFTSAVNSYDKAVKIFAQINSDFSNLDDLYLFYDDNLDKNLTELRSSYDSARFYFDRYEALIKGYPIAFHHQKYTVKPIITFRLDGLITRMNFLTDNVEFWDYATWVDQVRKSVKSEIAALRTKLVQNQEQLDQTITKINTPGGPAVVPFKLDKQLVFNLNNYDKQSLVLALLEYKAFKQSILIQIKNFQPDTINHDPNAEFYSSLIYSNRTADTLMEVVKTRLTAEKVRKHSEFLLKFYGNQESLKQYAESEQTDIKKSFDESSGHLRSELMAMIAASEQTSKPVIAVDATVKEKLRALSPVVKVTRFGKLSISSATMNVVPELLERGEPITLESKKGPDGTTYLAGIHKPDKKINNVVAFVAQLSPDGKAMWIKNFDFKFDSLSPASDANNYLGSLVLTQEGCAFLVNSVHLVKKNAVNTFVYLNEKGEEKFRRKMKDNGYPRKLSYNEKGNSFVMVLKGQEEKSAYSASEPVSIIGVNVLGDVMWTRSVDVAGTVIDLLNVIDGYLIVGNFMIIKDEKGKEFRTKVSAGESSPYLIKLSGLGDLVKIQPIPTMKSVYLGKVIKVSDNSIHLLGWEGTFDSGIHRSISSTDKLVTFMTNHSCQIVFSSP